MDYELIESRQEVVDNVRQFHQDLATDEDICSQLSQFRAWYYIPELDALGPSKFIGYKGMNASRYQRGDDKDGRKTEPCLRKFFRPIEKSHHWYAYLENKLIGTTAQYGKKPNKLARLNVPRGF
ncbi:hypothetical protein M1N79_04105 [Dehalococcoidia bacterium]|nr:hypothetical protein [Dehalococcoidia bacterium]